MVAMKLFVLQIIFILALALFVNYSIGESGPRPATGWNVQNVMAPFP